MYPEFETLQSKNFEKRIAALQYRILSLLTLSAEKKYNRKIALTFFLDLRFQIFLVLIISTLSETFIFSLFIITRQGGGILRDPY